MFFVTRGYLYENPEVYNVSCSNTDLETEFGGCKTIYSRPALRKMEEFSLPKITIFYGLKEDQKILRPCVRVPKVSRGIAY